MLFIGFRPNRPGPKGLCSPLKNPDRIGLATEIQPGPKSNRSRWAAIYRPHFSRKGFDMEMKRLAVDFEKERVVRETADNLRRLDDLDYVYGVHALTSGALEEQKTVKEIIDPLVRPVIRKTLEQRIDELGPDGQAFIVLASCLADGSMCYKDGRLVDQCGTVLCEHSTA